MKIKVDYLENMLILKDDKVLCIEIENKNYFYRIVSSLNSLMNSETTEEIKPTLYFDEKTNQKFSFLNKKVEKELHQNYLENHHIPFHLTIATYKEIEEKKFIEQANQLFEKESSQELYFVSLGCFQKSTLYLLPVYNEFLEKA